MSKSLRRAFLVGINYKGSDCELGGCINDVISTKELLIRTYGYEESNILVFTDNSVIKPTGANIRKGWQWLLSRSPAADFNRSRYTQFDARDKPVLFFHYSGHGSQARDLTGDEKDGIDETICPIDFRTGGMITDDIIRTELATRVPSGAKLFSLVDACHSESSLDLLWNATVLKTGEFTLTRAGNYLATPGEVALISGCQDFDTSADIVVAGKGQGALTYAFLSVLKKANYNITYDKLLVEIRAFLKNKRISKQVPCLSFGRSVQISSKFSL